MSFTKNLYAYSASFLPDQQKSSSIDATNGQHYESTDAEIRLSDYRDRKTHGYIALDDAEPVERNSSPTVLEKTVKQSKRNIMIVVIAVFLVLLGVFPILFGTVNIFGIEQGTSSASTEEKLDTSSDSADTFQTRETSFNASSSALTEHLSSTDVPQIYVYLTGEVNKIGIMRLPEGARLFDAIQAASGLTSTAAAEYINMARIVEDGEHIHIFSQTEVENLENAGETSFVPDISQAGNSNAASKININTATDSELQELPGIGPALSSRIIDFREKHGKFRDLTTLGAVSGIGPKMIENLSELVSF